MFKIYLVILILMLITGCGNKPADFDRPQVTVSILPQKYFVRQIAGELVKVQVMIPPGASPATFSPTPQSIAEVSRSGIYFKTGYLPFETSWLKKIAKIAGNMKIIDTSAEASLLKSGHNHHEKDHHQCAGGVDPHIWLSCREVVKQTRIIQNGLSELLPEKKDSFSQNAEKFLYRIRKLDVELKGKFSKLINRDFIIFHPVLGYFARDYHLVQHSIEFEGKKPSPLHLKKMLDMAKNRGIKAVFVQKQFDARAASSVAEEIDGKVVTIDPLAQDWLMNMKGIAEKIINSLD